MKKIRIGSYWRSKKRRQHIYKVFGFDKKYDLVDVSYRFSSLGFTTDRKCFLRDHEPLSRLETLVLFGETQ